MLLSCVRHGESTYNAENRVQGQTDIPLSELGILQSEAVAQALADSSVRARSDRGVVTDVNAKADVQVEAVFERTEHRLWPPIELVWSSPLRRALQTAQIIARRLNVPIVTDPRLKELDAGVFQGRLRRDLETLFPEEYARWLAGDLDFVIPQGESRRQLMTRGAAVLRDIAAGPQQHVVVVAHGGLLTAALRALLGTEHTLNPFALQNASITRLRIEPAGVTLIELNNTEHLRDIGPASGGDL